MTTTKKDVSRQAALLELFLMGKLSQPELEAELARPAEPESSFPERTSPRCS
jgi:hypothetical protein